MIKQRVKNYYENNKEILRERGKNKYRELSEEKKCKEAVPKKTDTVIFLMKKNVN